MVVEVKPSVTSESESREDLDHLRLFLERAEYFTAILLVYGDIEEKRLRYFAREFETIFAGLKDKQSLLRQHDRPGDSARVIHAIRGQVPHLSWSEGWDLLFHKSHAPSGPMHYQFAGAHTHAPLAFDHSVCTV